LFYFDEYATDVLFLNATMGISIRSYARARGVSDTAVRKAIKAGRITAEADGTIDAAKVDVQWVSNTDQALQRKAVPIQEPQAAFEQAPQPTVKQTYTRPSAEPVPPVGVPSSGGTSLLQARTANEVLKAQTNKVRLARMKGELVERSQAMAHVFRMARTERDAWLNWPARVSAQMAATLKLEPHVLHVVLEALVREHLQELGEVRVHVD
jgi:hypothetical protein